MQIYWYPVVISAALILLRVVGRPVRVPMTLQITLLALPVVVVLVMFVGENSDWAAYRQLVESCVHFGCTYFEPGFDAIMFFSASIGGFGFLKILLVLAFIASLLLILQLIGRALPVSFQYTALVVSVLPLMLGAIRQSLGLPFFLYAILLLHRGKTFKSFVVAVVGSSIHYSIGIAWLFAYLILVVTDWGRRFSSRRGVHLILLAISALLAITIFVDLSYIQALDFPILSRLGMTHYGTIYVDVDAGGETRDLLITLERVILTLLAVVLMCRVGKLERFIGTLVIVGNLIFFLFVDIDRNIAGRMLAYFRIFDILAISLAISGWRILSTRRENEIVAGFVIIMYALIKSYFSLATVGFFDD